MTIGPSSVALTTAAMRARVTADVWVQLFDRDNDGSVNESSGVDYDAITAAITTAQSIVAAELAVAYPDGFTSGGGAMDAAIMGCAVQIALYEACRYSPLATDSRAMPYRTGYEDALKALKRYRDGVNVRLTQAAGGGGPAHNQGSVGGVLNPVTGDHLRSFGRSSDGSDGSDF